MRRPAAAALLALTLPVLFAAAPAPPPLARIEKMARILSAEDRRNASGLERLVHDGDPGVRRRAALGAGRIGDTALTPAIVDLMNDGEVEVRKIAAFALGLMGDRAAVDRLIASLKDSDTVVRGRAAEALGRIGDPRAASEIARMVVEALPAGAAPITVRGDDPGSANDPWIQLRLGLFALARLKDAKAAEGVLLAGGKPRFDWWAATWTAMRLESPALKPVLVAAAASSDPLSRAFAARGLGSLKDPSALELIAALARDPDETVAVNAIRAAGLIGDARGVPIATSALGSTDLVLKAEALKALAALPPDRALRSRVVAEIGAREPWVRAAAFPALARIDREEFALVLSGLDPDPEWSVRASLATALGEVGDEISLGILYSMLKDQDPRVIPSVLEALRKARGHDSVGTLKDHLAHPDVAVRSTAAAGIAELKATGLTSALEAGYRASLPDSDLDARMAQIDALAVQNDPKASELLKEIAGADPLRLVRRRAAAALKGLGETPPDPGPQAVERPYLDYRDAMAPYDPMPGVPLYTPRAFLETRYGRIEMHLDVIETPLTTASFMALARRGFFDGLTFHRVVPGFVIQGGDPRGDGNGGPGYTLRCELGTRPYGRGTVGMALSGRDTGGSQFFITHVPTPHLDGEYTAFGWVVSGMEIVDRIRPGDVIQRVEVWDGR
jgi:cyclophilin family peptidyl-prolyl cis-trans isomerase/HEAT repeat protein